ncbi:putative F-box associated interaction domain-containing protein [Medicago truncatula]|uniref:F-box protein interaction domain protein n=1 Tax=Medicago truncatula TaxID=3880 RepID=G7I8H3_MEDTR|nr:F-box protein CPR1 [Medicago truncatula]AES60559.1 F-box protein interaction domain protein [Medicago truncatula]RHN79406.1 putative F-box associated interaction domain-containing protein [Medicago truncatula]
MDTYKVVSLSSYSCESDGIDGIPMKVFKTQVNIYTLDTHSLIRINDFPSIPPNGLSEGIIVSGTVNWFAYSTASGDISCVIVSLDLGKECYQEISEPNYDEKPIYLTLGMMRDCLCIFSYSHFFTDVWLMKEYGNKESWIKFIHLPYFGDHDSHYDDIHYQKIYCQKILYIFEDENDVLLVINKEFEKWKWVVCDSKNYTIKSFKIQKDFV